MIIKKDFYFLRHGETDLNAGLILHDHIEITLNANGRNQAHALQPIISTLPIQTICVSPFRRALETAEIVSHRLSCPFVVIDELSECTDVIWRKMIGSQSCETVHSFVQQVVTGINKALTHEGPVLIVAHGGVHWAMCHHMDIQEHHKVIGNCVPVYFSVSEEAEWRANCLATRAKLNEN